MQSDSDDPKTLVSTAWLAAKLGDPDLCVLDASWHLPDAGRSARAEFEAEHIPGALFFDLDAVVDDASPLPHMAPSPDAFAARMAELGVGERQQVVIYDTVGIFSAPRAWWTFRLMGQHDVAVLDGGLPKWRAEGRETKGASAAAVLQDPWGARSHLARMVRSMAEVADASARGEPQIVDARAATRFRGDAPEPRPGLGAGHIPGSRNLPWGELLAPDGTMKPAGDVRALFEAAGIDLTRPVITTCGSGVSAAILSLALERIGHGDHALYDGSWAEWGAGVQPVEKG